MKTVVTPHPYAGDGNRDHRGEDRCSICGMPKPHRNHKLPPAPPGQAEHRKRIGERE